MRTGRERCSVLVGLKLTAWLGILTSSAWAQNGVSWATNHYAVVGSSLGEIHRSINRARPWKREHTQIAVTEWHIRSRYAVATFQGGFRCSGFTTETSIRITMPRWREPEGVSPEVRSEWRRYQAALIEHEGGHGQIAVAAAAEMHRQVSRLGTEPDPDALRLRVDQLVAQVLDEYRHREVEYDRLTQHGASQGARLRRGGGQDARRSTDVQTPP